MELKEMKKQWQYGRCAKNETSTEFVAEMQHYYATQIDVLSEMRDFLVASKLNEATEFHKKVIEDHIHTCESYIYKNMGFLEIPLED
jgi:hypothetical protein